MITFDHATLPVPDRGPPGNHWGQIHERDQTFTPAKQAGGTTLRVSRCTDVAADLRPVFAHATDFHRSHQWPTKVVELTMSPKGPMQAGMMPRRTSLRLKAVSRLQTT